MHRRLAAAPHSDSGAAMHLQEAEFPTPVVSFDLRTVRTYIRTDDGDLTFIVHDDAVAVAYDSGNGTQLAQAILAAERMADQYRQLAELLRLRASSRAPVMSIGHQVPVRQLPDPPAATGRPWTW
jgi:hypothetical protein